MSQHIAKNTTTSLRQIPAYFKHNEEKEDKVQSGCEHSKMVETGGESAMEIDPMTKADLQAIAGRIDRPENGLLSKLMNFMQPISEQLEQLNLNIQKVASVAEGAMDLSMAQQEEIKALQEADEQHLEQIPILGNRQWYFNLKFKGLRQLVEENTELTV